MKNKSLSISHFSLFTSHSSFLTSYRVCRTGIHCLGTAFLFLCTFRLFTDIVAVCFQFLIRIGSEIIRSDLAAKHTADTGFADVVFPINIVFEFSSVITHKKIPQGRQPNYFFFFVPKPGFNAFKLKNYPDKVRHSRAGLKPALLYMPKFHFSTPHL